jgi:hypothetical protein
MTMYSASTAPTLREAAVGYFFEGLSVIPVSGKKCLMKWTKYQDEVAIPETINFWANNNVLDNVAIVCGQVSKNLVVVDLDGKAAIEAFERTFPYLLDTFTVLTGSGKGKHLYYRVESLPPTTRVVYPNHQAVELRANGCYVVAPPSIHPETHLPYRPAFSAQIKKLPHMEDVKRWLYAQLARKEAPRAMTGKRTIYKGNTPAWANAALGYECRDVRFTKEGNRHNQLFISARNLGQIVGDGDLQEAVVRNALLNEALGVGLGERDALAVIQSGLTKGIAEPRSTQWLRRSK